MVNHTEENSSALTQNLNSGRTPINYENYEKDRDRLSGSNLAKWFRVHAGATEKELQNLGLGVDAKGQLIVYSENLEDQIINGMRYRLSFQWPKLQKLREPEYLIADSVHQPIFGIRELLWNTADTPVLIVDDPLLAVLLNCYLDDYCVIACPDFRLPSRYVHFIGERPVKVLPQPEFYAYGKGQKLAKALVGPGREVRLCRWGKPDLMRLEKSIWVYLMDYVQLAYEEASYPFGKSIPGKMRQYLIDKL